MAQRMPEMFFCWAKNWEHLNFLGCIHVFGLALKLCSEVNEGIWLQLLVYSVVFMNIVTSVVGMSFCPSVFWVLAWDFLVLHFYGNVCNLIPKLFATQGVWFWVFFLENGFFLLTSYFLGLNSARISNLLFLFFDGIKTFRWLVWAVFWSVL